MTKVKSMTDNGNGAHLEFDLDALKHIKAKEMASLIRGTDVEATAGVLARVVKSCPYGDASDPQTYLELDYDNGEDNSFVAVQTALGEAIKNARKR